MKFSSILKNERQRQGWSQATLANHLGTTANRISVWERGLESPSPYFRNQLSKVFAKSIAELGLLDKPFLQGLAVQGSAEMVPIWDPMIPATSRIGLIGRTSAIGQIIASLTEMKHTTHHVALWGLPGVGKTALAVGVLAQQAILVCLLNKRFLNSFLMEFSGRGLAPIPLSKSISTAGICSWNRLLCLQEAGFP
jgi:transcriptional regulator with XRE-family HTH domain